MDGYISGMLATGNVYLTVVYMWNNNHKPVDIWYLKSTCPNPLLFVTFSLQLDSDGNGSDQNISEYSYGLFAYLKCRPDKENVPNCREAENLVRAMSPFRQLKNW